MNAESSLSSNDGGSSLFEGIAAAVGIIGAAIASLGWWREKSKDKKQERRSDLDILLGGFRDLLADQTTYRTKAEEDLAAMLQRALDCEEREKRLRSRVDALEGAIRGD